MLLHIVRVFAIIHLFCAESCYELSELNSLSKESLSYEYNDVDNKYISLSFLNDVDNKYISLSFLFM